MILGRRRPTDLYRRLPGWLPTMPAGFSSSGGRTTDSGPSRVGPWNVRLVGIYTNPQHVVEYSDGEVRQQFSVCFACRPAGGGLATSDESSEVRYFTSAEIETMDVHPSIRLRIADFKEGRTEPVIA